MTSASGHGWELRLGRWQDVLNLEAVRGAAAVIADPPYSKRNVAGYRSGAAARRGSTVPADRDRYVIPYRALEEAEAAELTQWITLFPAPWWAVIFGDHMVWGWLEAAFPETWATFAPVGWAKPNPPPRMGADGPCCAIEHILVARPRKRLPPERRGSRPGCYYDAVEQAGGQQARIVVGQKPLSLMRKITMDYTIPGDLVVDPYAGSGTTLAAAILEGRRAVGAEMDPGRFEAAVRRLRVVEESLGELGAGEALAGQQLGLLEGKAWSHVA